MSESIGIGFVGAGANTRLRHLPGFSGIEGVRLVTVANRSEGSSQAVADAFGIERVASDWREVVEDPEVEAICIGTWPYMHAEVSIAALKAGKHVLTEARMSSTLEEAKRMLEASRSRPDLVAQVVPSPFTLDLDETVLSILQSGRLGEVREIFIDHANSANLDPEAPLNWRQDRHYSGINKLSLGIYHEAVQRWFPGDFMVHMAISATATRERRHWETGEMVPVEIPDMLHILGSREDSSLLNYHFTSIEEDEERNEIRLVGIKASLTVDVGKQTLSLSEDGENFSPVEIPESARRGWRVEEDFINSIRTGAPVQLTSFAEGLRYMEFTNSVEEALGQ